MANATTRANSKICNGFVPFCNTAVAVMPPTQLETKIPIVQLAKNQTQIGYKFFDSDYNVEVVI
jgi:hypothetical protein